MKIKKGDTVVVIAGKDKGKKGKVIESFPRELRVVVEGVNMHKKHAKPRRSGQKGQIVAFAAPIHVSNVALTEAKEKPARAASKKTASKTA